MAEEIGVNARLARAGIEAVETDLGEYIVSLAGQRPSHITAPAIHLSRQDVGKLFAEKLGLAYTDDPAELSIAAREQLRPRYAAAQVGLTGANFAVAQTGTVVVVENEGNAGLCAAAPPVHVIVMGIEKVIPALSDLPVFLALLGRAATGQKLTSYTHHLLGPEAGKKLYCIIVDAGRTRVLGDPNTRSSLGCIRCGACMNVCPVYRRVGGAAYGAVYPGPIGSVITPQMIGPDKAGELAFASSLCGACREECPVAIDLPEQLVYMRHRAVAARAAAPLRERIAFCLWAVALSDVRLYGALVRIARALQRSAVLLRRLRLFSAGNYEAGRLPLIPPIASVSFKQWWSKRR